MVLVQVLPIAMALTPQVLPSVVATQSMVVWPTATCVLLVVVLALLPAALPFRVRTALLCAVLLQAI